ncbi:hypothetical protein ACUXST_001732 [Sphingomonas sp. F9_3S_D5_B_2]
MRKQMIENAAYEVATQIRVVEESIEGALVELAELQTKMVHARTVTNANISGSHCAFEQLAATTRDLIAARGSIGGCHSALVETKGTIPGLRTVAWGDDGDCPPANGSARADLRIVS